MELWRMIKLSPAQRASLAKELSDVLERYTIDPPEVGAEPFLVHAAFAPALSQN
jgi:hypothetical protein